MATLLWASLLASWLTIAPPAVFPHGTVALVSATAAAPSGGAVTLGLEFHLDPGWHIYWRNPGDSGEPPTVTWHLPAGWRVDELEWPHPQRLGSATIVDYGYENSVLLLAPAHAPATPGSAAQIVADLKILICKNECIPTRAHVSVTLPVLPPGTVAPPDAALAPLFAGARARLPHPLPAGWSVTAQEDAKGYTLTIRAGRRLQALQVFPLSETQIDNAAPARLTPTADGALLHLGRATEDLKPSTRLPGVMVLAGGETYAFDAPVTAATR